MTKILSSLFMLAMALLVVGCCSNCNKKGALCAADSTVRSEIKVVADSVIKTVTTPPITATFVGGDGKTRRLYQVTVVFYPSEERATLSDDQNTYQLKQYVTADGYGYKSEDADLRGKGRDATLTYSDGTVLKLTEKQSDQK